MGARSPPGQAHWRTRRAGLRGTDERAAGEAAPRAGHLAAGEPPSHDRGKAHRRPPRHRTAAPLWGIKIVRRSTAARSEVDGRRSRRGLASGATVRLIATTARSWLFGIKRIAVAKVCPEPGLTAKAASMSRLPSVTVLGGSRAGQRS